MVTRSSFGSRHRAICAVFAQQTRPPSPKAGRLLRGEALSWAVSLGDNVVFHCSALPVPQSATNAEPRRRTTEQTSLFRTPFKQTRVQDAQETPKLRRSPVPAFQLRRGKPDQLSAWLFRNSWTLDKSRSPRRESTAPQTADRRTHWTSKSYQGSQPPFSQTKTQFRTAAFRTTQHAWSARRCRQGLLNRCERASILPPECVPRPIRLSVELHFGEQPEIGEVRKRTHSNKRGKRLGFRR